MRVTVVIEPGRKTNLEYACVRLEFGNGLEGYHSWLNFDFHKYRVCFPRWRRTNRIALEFLFIAHIVYVVDKMISRKTGSDHWTRDICVNIPTQHPDVWNGVKSVLEERISFLTGDLWEVEFYDHRFAIGRPPSPVRLSENAVWTGSTRAISLFSGGLDSLIGVIDWLESNQDGSLFLVGHHDGAGPDSQQKALFNLLRRAYRGRVNRIGLMAGHRPAKAKDNNLRSRSFLFLALGVLCAQQFCSGIPLLIPENGTISLNVPLTPARRGSLSTRTCHPYFLDGVQEILSGIGITTPITNPLADKTKGECAIQCLNQDVLKAASPESVSCGKAGRKRFWTNRNAKACGACVPCIYRRASLHRIGADTEIYGYDIAHVSDHDLAASDLARWDDLQAIISFIKRNYSTSDIKQMLISGGHLDISRLNNYANLIERSRQELIDFLNAKASYDVRNDAGVI